MTAASPIEDVDELPGKPIFDALGQKIGAVGDIYVQDGDPMWVTIESSTGLFTDRLVFIPLARLKEEEGQIRAPYTAQHLNKSPEVQAGDELSEEDDRALRAYYSVGIGDAELRTQNDDSYASRVPDGEGPVKKASAER
jgi:hypothetical protein